MKAVSTSIFGKSRRQKPAFSVLNNIFFLLKRILRTDKLYFLLLFLTAIFYVINPLLNSYLPKLMIDGLALDSMAEYLGRLFLFAVLLAFSKFMIARLEVSVQSRSEGQRFYFLAATTNNMTTLDYQYLTSKDGTDKMFRALNQAAEPNSPVGKLFGQSMVRFLTALFSVALFGGILIHIHYLLLIFIIGTALLHFGYGYLNASFHERVLQETAAPRRKTDYIQKKTTGPDYAKDLRVYKMQNWFPNVYEALEKELFFWEKKDRFRDYLGNLLNLLFAVLRDALAYIYLIRLFVSGEISIGTFVFMLGIVRSFATLTGDFFESLNRFQKASPDINEVRAFLSIEDGLIRDQGASLPTTYDIFFDNVSFRYSEDGPWVIKDLTLQIENGESLAVVGLNGAGKTTLCSLLIGLLHPTRGRILIGGVDLETLNIYERYKLFSTVFQDCLPIPESISDFITCDKEKQDPAGVEQVIKEAKLISKIENLPEGANSLLMKTLNPNGIDLSGGEIQRLCLARALYRNAPINILDEPTAALDPIAERSIYENYFDMTRGKTSIFISHRLASTRFCSRIIFLADGEIKELGTHQELMDAKQEYRRIFEMQAHYYKEGVERDEELI
ncbi:MAG: ABC transporter ATP-binding protein [Eubacteriales bacterium]|nr:ABC transporter ATP-binding protein [Eubacteriales bacterium]